MLLLAIMAACRPAPPSPPNGLEACWVKTKEGPLFVGSEACFRVLPMQRMHGYWVVGFEFSRFHPGDGPVPQDLNDPSFVPLVVSGGVRREVGSRRSDLRTLQIEFMGIDANTPGIYAMVPTLRGVYAHRLLSFREVASR